MGLRDVFQAAAVTAFNAAGDVVVEVTYVELTPDSGDFRPSRGRSVLRGKKHRGMGFIFEKFNVREIDGAVVLAGDQNASIPKLNLIDGDGKEIIPLVGHQIHKSDHDAWAVEGVGIDPADALWVLQIRQTNNNG